MCATFSFAQTPSMMVTSKDNSGISAERVFSIDNAWFGAKVLMDVKGELIIPSAKFMYIPISGPRYAIPILSNVNLSDSLDIDNGLSLGLFPWYNISNDEQFRFNLHGGIAYQFVPGDIENKFRMLAGFEISMYGKEGGLPISLSVAPEYIRAIQTGEDNFGLTIVGAIPVANGLGAMFEGSVPLDESEQTDFKVGIVYILNSE
jgi:hypothetical protein